MKVTEINIYPIKSTRRIALQQSAVLPRGLPWDRRWMLVDAEGRFITARQHPTLALVQTDVKDDVMQVSAAGHNMLQLPLQPPDGQITSVTVWHDVCDAVLAGAEADAWCSDYLGFSCRLVQMSDEGELLAVVSNVFLKTCRKSDTVARLGGDEFVVIYTELESLQVIEAFASRIIDALKSPVNLKAGKVTVGARIGSAGRTSI